MSLLQRYLALNKDSPSKDKLDVLQAVTNASPLSVTATDRAKIVKELLGDLAKPKGGRLTSDAVLPAVVALKTLGRDRNASAIISEPQHFETLHSLAKSQQPDISKEALRCVANAVLLVDSARDNWLSIGGGETCLAVLSKETSPDYVFLGSRILFVTTVQQSPFILKVVNELNAVGIINTALESLMGSFSAGRPQSKEALIDTLKFAFNLLLQYPRMVENASSKADKNSQRVMGELWDEKFDSLVPTLLHLFNSLPHTTSAPLAPPLTHVIHALLNVPIEPFKALWFPSSELSTPGSSKSDPLQKAKRAFSRPSSPPKSHDTLKRAYDLLDATLAHYITGDPDDPAVRSLCRNENIVLDDAAPPLPLLLGRMVRDDAGARARMKEWLLPPDLDRSEPLEKKHNLLGRCLRLLTSVYFTKLKNSIGELLFAICNSDANQMVLQLGYGNCAGFLFNKGIMAPPPASSGGEDGPQDPDINPITGAKRQTSANDELAAMSEEEKEREAEKLFVLFDRMEKMGMAVNPVRKAMQEGRFEEIP